MKLVLRGQLAHRLEPLYRLKRHLRLKLRDILEADDNENYIPPTPIQPKTKSGDLVRLGGHRLFCGDSASNGVLNDLMGKKEVELVFAGPPCFNQCGLGDWKDYSSYSRDMAHVIRQCVSLLRDGGILVWHITNDSSRHLNMVAHHSVLLEEAGLEYLDFLVWKKPTANYASPRNIQIKQYGYYTPAPQWEALLYIRNREICLG